MLTIGKLARQFGLSRSTLLYYDRIGLLKPSGRSPANYRIYNAGDARRLERICLYRKAGLALSDIAAALDAGSGTLALVLEQRLSSLNHQISALRRQQHLIVSLLQGLNAVGSIRIMDKASWVRLLRAAGMDDDDMRAWHRAFEQISPEAHQHFLVSLGLPVREVKAIQERSRRSAAKAT